MLAMYASKRMRRYVSHMATMHPEPSHPTDTLVMAKANQVLNRNAVSDIDGARDGDQGRSNSGYEETEMFKKVLITGAAAVAMTTSAFSADIVDTASEAGNFATLIAAVEAAGLVETLKGEGPFTVFAPRDEAFEALPEGTLDDLLLEENRDQLVSILSYHVVSGSVASTDLTEGMTAATVEGSEVTFAMEGEPKVNDANITQPDIEADNGVIHVIDKVIMPSM